MAAYYTDEQIRKYLSMYLDGVSISKICSKGGPSRPTFYKWKNEGYLTDGEPWDEYKDRMDRERAIATRERELAERRDTDEMFMSSVQKDIREMYDVVVEAVKEGKVDINVSDVERLVRLYANVDHRQQEFQDWKEKFASWMFATAMDIMNEQQFATFKLRVREKMISESETQRQRGQMLLK